MVSEMISERAVRENMEAGGTVKLLLLVMCLSIMVACLMKKVLVCVAQMPKTNVESHMGITLMISFASSTFVNVTSFHGLCFWRSRGVLSSIIAALSRNLQAKNNYAVIIDVKKTVQKEIITISKKHTDLTWFVPNFDYFKIQKMWKQCTRMVKV